MKAILVREFGGPEVLKLEEVPTPKPGAGQVLVRIHAAGVNPYDTYMRAGSYAVKPQLPYTPGSDGAGVVEAVGDGVKKVKPGDRVYTAKIAEVELDLQPKIAAARSKGDAEAAQKLEAHQVQLLLAAGNPAVEAAPMWRRVS